MREARAIDIIAPDADVARTRPRGASAEVDAVPAALEGVVVDQIGHRQTARRKAVSACIDRRISAADHTTDKIGVARHMDAEAAVTREEPALLRRARKIPVAAHVVGIDTHAAVAIAIPSADGRVEAAAAVLAVVGAGVLKGLDVQVAAHVGIDTAPRDRGAPHSGVSATGDIHLLARLYVGVRPCAIGAVVPAALTAGGHLDREAVALPEREANADAGVAAVAGGTLLPGIGRRLERDVVIRRQVDVLAGADLAAAHEDIGVLPATRGGDGDIPAGLHA